MKLIKSIIVIANFSFATNLLNAATTFTVSNFNGASSGVPLVDASGNALSISSVGYAVGSFDFSGGFTFGSANELTDDANVFSRFTQSGLADTLNTDGFFNRSLNNVDPGNSFLGVSSYLLIGNNTNLSLANDFIVIDLGVPFPMQDGAGNATASASLNSGSQVVFGESGVNVTLSTLAAPFQNAAFASGVTFNPIPEPSFSLLLSVAGLGLVARRRK